MFFLLLPLRFVNHLSILFDLLSFTVYYFQLKMVVPMSSSIFSLDGRLPQSIRLTQRETVAVIELQFAIDPYQTKWVIEMNI